MHTPRFVVVNRGGRPENTVGTFTLVIDGWDDFHFRTSFMLHYGTGKDSTELGAVKIAALGMVKYGDHTDLPEQFSQLGDQFFALGQDREYYEAVMKLPDGIGLAALHALRDVAQDSLILEQVQGEEVFSTSLLRSVPAQTVVTQFRRIVEGKAVLTPYKFSYSRTLNEPSLPLLHLDFGVQPDAMPPTNVHVLIGANGVGKSRLLRDFVDAASGASTALGTFQDERASDLEHSSEVPFTNVVHVAFSAFDRDDAESAELSRRVDVHAVGLSDKDTGSLGQQFVKSLIVCSRGPRKGRWLTAISTLSGADGILSDASFGALLTSNAGGLDKTAALQAFEYMSSGHKIVVLTVTRLVELVEERSLVLIDEPETHLHPPLLSALTRAVSDLANDRNGVAIMATHSPVVLQEVPCSCVWMLQRSGDDLRASRLPTETFGESVSRLSSEVFHLDVNRTGFNEVLRELLAKDFGSAERVMEELDDQLGSEGRFVLSSLEYQQGGDHV